MNRLKALKDPAKSGPLSDFTELIRKRLVLLEQSVSEVALAEVVHEEAQPHHQGKRHDAFGGFEEDTGGKKQGGFEEAKAALVSLLSLVLSLVCLALVSIPLVNLVLVPLCVIGGTLLVCDRLLPPSVPSGNPSGSSSTISPRDSDDRVTK
jgi:hypothetical protein